jgi:hypothetical protein
MPDHNAQSRTDDEGNGEGGGTAPKSTEKFKETHLNDSNEAFDPQHTGKDSSLEKNSKESAPKTSLEDVMLAKPKGSTQKGEQPIPLEYKDILQ